MSALANEESELCIASAEADTYTKKPTMVSKKQKKRLRRFFVTLSVGFCEDFWMQCEFFTTEVFEGVYER